MKQNVYVLQYIFFIYQNHFAVHQKLTQLCKSAIPQFKKRAQIRFKKKTPKTPKLILSAIQGLSALNKDIPIHTVIPSPDGTYFWNVSDFRLFC